MREPQENQVMVAITAPKPTRWEMAFIILLFSLLALGFYIQYSVMANAITHDIPQIVTATPEEN